MSIIVGAAMGGRLASIDALSLVFQAGFVVQLVLLVLLTLSVVSWTIIVYKWRELRRAGQDSEAFLEVYQEGSLDAAYSKAKELNRSPLAGIFVAAYAELSRMLRFAGKGPLEEKHLQALGATHRLGRLAGGACASSAASTSSRPRAARRPSSGCSAP